LNDPHIQTPINVNVYRDQTLKVEMQPLRQKRIPDLSFLLTKDQIENIYNLIVEPNMIAATPPSQL
jgi:hypothetical protein